MKLAAFDIEIAKEVEGDDWLVSRPLGISCAAVRAEGVELTYDSRYYGSGQLPEHVCQWIVEHLSSLVEIGHTIVTVNGAGFDFDILAEESGLHAECAELAMNHIDLCFMPLCRFGWPVGLDALAKGQGVEPKLHEVTLSTGKVIDDMSGAAAPRLWVAGEYDAVLAYLKQDVKATLETAAAAFESGRLKWQSRKGKWWGMRIHEKCTVADCLSWPSPDTSWMSNPISRHETLRWTNDERVMSWLRLEDKARGE